MESPTIKNKTITALIAVIVGLMVVVLALLISITFQFGIIGNLVTSWVLTAAYAIFAFFLIQPIIQVNPVRTIEKPVVQQVLVPVDREVIREIQVPIENKTIEVVEKPVIKEVPVEVIVRKNVIKYVERKHRKLNIPKFKFIGSTQTKRFHKRTCKFSKLIKKKYKLHSNAKTFFKKKHYKKCKACIKR